MITDKRFLIIAGCVVVAVLLVIGLGFLQRLDDDGDFSSLDLLEDDNEDDGEDAVGYYRIVLSGACSPEVADAARELSATLEELTGIDCAVTYDSKDVPDRTDAVEILIGNTSRNSSAVALEGLRSYDYVCKWINGSLVIGGLSNSATLDAIGRFAEEALPYATATELMSPDFEFSYNHDYEVDSIKLCGFEISDYSIVCSEETVEYARILADSVSQKGGYFLEIEQGTARKLVKEIVFAIDDSAEGSAYVGYDGEDVRIKAKDAYGVSVAFAKLYEMLSRVDDGRISADIPTQTAYPYIVPDIHVMNIISKITIAESSLPSINDAIGRIRLASPDVVVFGNVDSDVLDMIMYGISGYKCAMKSNTYGDVIAVLYRTQTVSLTLDKTETDGLSVIKMCVKHSLSGEEYESVIVAGVTSVSADKVADIVSDNVSDTRNTFVTLMLRNNESNDLGFSADGLFTKHNAGVYLNNYEYSTAVLCGDTITNSAVSTGYNNSRTAVFFDVTFGKAYCGDYLKNIQQ